LQEIPRYQICEEAYSIRREPSFALQLEGGEKFDVDVDSFRLRNWKTEEEVAIQKR
jgi:hypothetical protein